MTKGSGELFLKIKDSIENSFFNWKKDFGKMLELLGGPWSMIFLFLAIMIGVFPVIIAGQIGDLFSATVGARGVGVTTLEASNKLIVIGVMVMAWFAMRSFTERLEGGLYRTIGRLIEAVMFLSAVITIVRLERIFPTIILLILFLLMKHVSNRKFEFVMLISLGFVLFYLAKIDLEFLVRKIISYNLFIKIFFSTIIIWSFSLKTFFGKKKN